MVLIEHTEYILDLISSPTANTFLLQQFEINPGQSFLFPWLSTISGNFVNYLFESLELYFISTTTTAITSATNMNIGTCGGRCVVDPTIAVDNSLIQILNSHDKTVTVPYKNFFLKFPCSGANKGSYTVRTGAQPTGTDLRMYDIGYFEMFTAAITPVSQDIGQIHVKYKVHLFKPQYIQGEVGYTLRSAFYTGLLVGAASPLGTSWTARSNNYLALEFTATTITFPVEITVGTYKVDLVWSQTAAGGTFVAPVISSVTNGGVGTMFPAPGGGALAFDASAEAPVQAAAATGQMMFSSIVSVTAPGSSQCVIIFSSMTIGNGNGPVAIYVNQWNGLMTSP